MSKFDAAIRLLNEAKSDINASDEYALEYESALDVLRSVALLERSNALAWLNRYGTKECLLPMGLYELIHALPDDTDAKEKP